MDGGRIYSFIFVFFGVVSVGATTLDLVDPLIGTEGDGSEYGGMQPYTCVPFGSFHVVPMTRTNEIGRVSFNSSDANLLGIILTRQPAIWMGDWGEVRVAVPPAKIEGLDAKPYLTRVTAGGRMYEYTATAHAAWIRGLDAATVLAFPESGINTNRMDAKYGYPLSNFGGRWYADKSRPGELKIGLSLISVEQAKANLEKEVGSRTFDEVVAGTKAQWEEMFSRVEIEAPDDVKTIFYTGLYHTLLYPRQMDEDGRYYSAFDDKVHSGMRYNCFSLWDTYRAEHPWLTLIAPERVDGMMQSLVNMYKEGGWLPKWPNPSYTGIMVGAPAEIVLQEARTKGFTGFDWATAQEAIRKNATVPQEYDAERRWEDRGIFGRAPETRAGLTSYLKRGYVACDETAESVSRTQDFSLADRNRNYTNLWCAAEGMFLPRKADGSFVSRKDLKPPYHDYCEQQPETSVWAVPHDPEGLAELMGGKAEAIHRLDKFFDTIFFKPDGRGNSSIHGNETSHHCAYLYNRFGAPEKTQQRVRQILRRCYSTNRKGFDGNEDCGQMSAWYIMSALGFYPLDPAGGNYELGSPIVRSAVLRFGAPYEAAELRITVKNYAPDRWRVKRVMFNGQAWPKHFIAHADLVKGGELIFEMEDNPNSVKVIFDTDMICDFDDVGALACLHAMADAGECEILATISSTRGNASVAAIEVINGYYGRGDLPVGAPKGLGVMGAYSGAKEKVDPKSPLGNRSGGDGGHYKYRKLAVDYPQWVKHLDSDDAPDANETYRKVLAAAPDKSVVICSVGFLTNLRRLLETKPDEISPLDGRALVAKKVVRWVAMACNYPSGKEYNSEGDAESSRIALANWPTPVVFSDFQYGKDCYAGRKIAEANTTGPVADVFRGQIPSREDIGSRPSFWFRENYGMGGRSAWDETAVLAAVRGADSYFNVHRGTYRMIGTNGEDEWVPDEENGPHLRLTEKANKLEVGKVIDELICRKPLKK